MGCRLTVGHMTLAHTIGVQFPAAQQLFFWRVRLVVRTPASHAGNTGSTPVRATTNAPVDQLDRSSGYGPEG